MKKYFMKDTEDELQFGDMIELDLTEDLHNGHVKHKHLECKFIPDLVSMLVENDIIDVVETKDEVVEENTEELEEEENDEEEDDIYPMLKYLVEAYDSIAKDVDELHKEIYRLKNHAKKAI